MTKKLVTMLTVYLPDDDLDNLKKLQRLAYEQTKQEVSISHIIAACIDRQLERMAGDHGDRFTITALNTTHNTTQQETQQ